MTWLRLITVLWALLVAVALLLPGDAMPERLPWLEWLSGWADKLGHFTLFAVLAGLLWRSLGERRRQARPVALAVALAALYGLALELAQLRIAGRSLETLDLAANLIGALTGPSLALWLEVGVARSPRDPAAEALD